ncbi:MAG: hypothetical protein V8Q40_10860 [Anaerosacchariphilus sp.]
MKYAASPAAPARGQNTAERQPQKDACGNLSGTVERPLIFVLFVAAAISILLGEVSDAAIIILTVILVNALSASFRRAKPRRPWTP